MYDEWNRSYREQQSPHLDPKQVNPPVAPWILPQRAFRETLTEADGAAADDAWLGIDDEVIVNKVEATLVHVP